MRGGGPALPLSENCKFLISTCLHRSFISWKQWIINSIVLVLCTYQHGAVSRTWDTFSAFNHIGHRHRQALHLHAEFHDHHWKLDLLRSTFKFPIQQQYFDNLRSLPSKIPTCNHYIQGINCKKWRSLMTSECNFAYPTTSWVARSQSCLPIFYFG
jgi:hypothetical protein